MSERMYNLAEFAKLLGVCPSVLNRVCRDADKLRRHKKQRLWRGVPFPPPDEMTESVTARYKLRKWHQKTVEDFIKTLPN